MVDIERTMRPTDAHQTPVNFRGALRKSMFKLVVWDADLRVPRAT